MAKQIKKIAVTNAMIDAFVFVWCDTGYLPAIEEIEGVTQVSPDGVIGRYQVYLDPRYDRDEVIKEIEQL